jgi:shikimate kinase / 3-dehydroquinate synthase
MTWRGRHIYLIGLPGAGKTSIGKELAALLSKSGYAFIDLDEEIIRKSGRTISELFNQSQGAERFRDLETNLLLEYAQLAFEQRPLIIATGGGTPLRAVNRALMRGSGVTVWIDVTVKQASKNVMQSLLHGETRPLLHASSPEELLEKLRALHAERLPFYEQATLHFVTRSQRGDDHTSAELGEELLRALEQMSRRIKLRSKFEIFPVRSALGDYPVAIGNGIAAQELAFAIRDQSPRRVVVITDENVAKLYGSKFYERLSQESKTTIDLHQIAVSPGEGSKSQKTLFDVLNSFQELDLRRKSDLIVTLGGGVVSDLGGLAASLYARGMALIHVPTTLIGQVDASLGGKTGIDQHTRKNLIGTFYTPRLVIIDPLFLKTLPKRELQAGLAEVLKYGLIGSREYWQRHAKTIRRLLRGFDPGFEILIRDAVREKIKYIEQDEFERAIGVRELLNFGHTFAHAFESATSYQLLHGEAVVLGMRAAAWLSYELGMLADDEWREVEQVLGRLPMPQDITIPVEEVIAALQHDKKRGNKGTRFVLLESIGKAVAVDDVDPKKVAGAVEFVLSSF